MKKVIVIIVTYKGMKWYKNCFDSLRQSTIPLQTIVIDNNSSDDTVAFIKKHYPEIHLVESDKNLGFGRANNIGFRYAIEQNADYVFLLNQDAWVKPDTIEKLIIKQKANPEFGILSPIHFNGKEDKVDHFLPIYIQPERCPNLISDYIVHEKPFDQIYPVLFINAALWLISKECFTDVGGFAPIFPHYGEDENYACRVFYHGYKIGIYPMTHAVHDRHPKDDSQISSKIKRKRDLIRILIILMNIDQPLFSCYYRVYFELLVLSIKYLFQLNFNKLFANIINSFHILFLFPRIKKERTICLRRGLSFII